MNTSIYTPTILAYARLHGVSDLRAYRLVTQREAIKRSRPFQSTNLCK